MKARAFQSVGAASLPPRWLTHWEVGIDSAEIIGQPNNPTQKFSLTTLFHTICFTESGTSFIKDSIAFTNLSCLYLISECCPTPATQSQVWFKFVALATMLLYFVLLLVGFLPRIWSLPGLPLPSKRLFSPWPGILLMGGSLRTKMLGKFQICQHLLQPGGLLVQGRYFPEC